MPSNSAQTAYAAIRQAIVEGRYRPGQRLVEQRVGEEFALSRTPVREALKLLHAEGLVLTEPNKGAVVRPLTLTDVEDIYELRAELESYAARRAAARITPDEVAEIDAAIDAFDAAVDGAAAGDLAAVQAVHAANATIHATLVGAARHDRLAQMLGRTVDVPLVFQAFRRFSHDELVRSNLFHRLLRHAVATGDADRAGRLMTEHVQQGRDVLLATMAEVASTDGLFAG